METVANICTFALSSPNLFRRRSKLGDCRKLDIFTRTEEVPSLLCRKNNYSAMDQAFRLDGDNNCFEYVNVLIKQDLSTRMNLKKRILILS